MWNIAIKTLVADRGKLITALAGVVFSVVLVNLQGGLFLGLMERATLLVDNGAADIWVGHHKMHNVDFTVPIPTRWINRVRTVPGVERAEPYLVSFSHMTLPSGGFEEVLVVGVEPSSLMGNAWNLKEGQPQDILKTDGIIVDVYEDEKLEQPRVGDLREIGRHRAKVVARTEGIMGFLVAPYVFTTIDRARSFTRTRPDECSYYLVETAPGANVEQVCAEIRRRVPELDAWPKETYSKISLDFWLKRTGIGVSFGSATVLGLLVGLVVVCQTLYALVLDRLPEYGTLKAIGARDRQIGVILLLQGCLMAVAGSAIGLALVALIKHLNDNPKAPMVIPPWVSMGSCALVLAICLISSVLPYLRIRKVDPLMVLQS